MTAEAVAGETCSDPEQRASRGGVPDQGPDIHLRAVVGSGNTDEPFDSFIFRVFVLVAIDRRRRAGDEDVFDPSVMQGSGAPRADRIGEQVIAPAADYSDRDPLRAASADHAAIVTSAKIETNLLRLRVDKSAGESG